MSIVLQSSGGGSVTIQEPTTASNFTTTLPASDGTVMVSGNMPTFSAYYSSGSPQSFTNGTFGKVQFQTEEFDTANCFDSTTNYRFTPNVAGYYQINSSVTTANFVGNYLLITVYKNGSRFKDGCNFTPNSIAGPTTTVNTIVYANGSSDYFEIYIIAGANTTITAATPFSTYFQASMVRGA
jgi:hypothetical protein